MIRIGGGKYHSRLLEVPSYLEVPTKEIVRLGIANALTPFLKGACALDLFAGSGALGFEALSRGAMHVDFVDNNFEAVETIKRNALKLDCQKEIRVFHADFLSFLKNSDFREKYSLVFLDPPYLEKGFYLEAVKFLFEKQLLSSSAHLVLEYEKEEPISPLLSSYSKRTYNYGRSKVSIYHLL